MTLAELGAQLREERVGQGLMVEDVAARLKIPARILRAIEAGEINDLPHTVYTRGFIKGYGTILGYSNQRITELLDALEDFDEDFSPPKTVERRPVMDNGADTGPRRGLGLLLKLLVITLLAGGGYAYYTHTFRDSGEATRQLPVSEGMPSLPAASENAAAEETPGVSLAPAEPSAVAAPAATVETRLPPPLSATSGPSAPADTAVAEETAPDVTQATGPAPADEESAAEAGEGSEAEPVSTRGFATAATAEQAAGGQATDGATGRSVPAEAALPAGMHQIVLTADASCWVHANADDTTTREFTLKVGETFAMPFKKSLVLRLGNAGGVKIKYDGREMPSPGASGQVKTLRFPPGD